jgi:hypothetical protein
LERGEGVAHTPACLEQITQKALANARKGKKVSPDVTR